MPVNVVQLKNENQSLHKKVNLLEVAKSELHEKVKSLEVVKSELEVKASNLEEKLKFQEEENRCLYHNLILFQKNKFGPKSEAYNSKVNFEQLSLFNEIEQEASSLPQGEVEEEFETITYNRKKKGRRKRLPFPEDLPREEVVIDLKEEEKFCPHDGTPLKEIGEDRVEKLKTVPARSTVVVEIKKKYACSTCQEYLTQAKQPCLLPKTIATPELLSFLIFSKFFQALPFYRLEELYRLQKIYLTRGTMARWLIQVTEKLMPIWNILEEKVLECEYMAIDATPVQVLKEKGRSAQSKSFMWARGSPELNITLFDYDISGGGKVAEKLIQGFQGGVQADAHKGYKTIDRTNITFLGCLMHARRRFYNAWVIGQKKTGLAETGLKMIKKIYLYEESYKKKCFTSEQRHEARQREVAPYMEKMRKWCEDKRSKVLPKSKLGNAINYFFNEYNELSAFLQNGRYEADNGWIERAIRKFAIGRNNWLFSDSVPGAESSALLYSLVLTAKLNEKDPFEVMTEIFKKLPYAKTLEDYEKLANLLLKSRAKENLIPGVHQT